MVETGRQNDSLGEDTLKAIATSAAAPPSQDAQAATSLSFEDVYRQHRRMVASLVRSMAGPQIDADDLVQQVFLELHRSWNRFRGDSSMKTFLRRIAVNVTLHELRRNRWRRFLSAGHSAADPDELPHPTSPGRASEARQALRHLDAALGELSPRLRAAFVLVDVEGLTSTEAAEVLGIPPNTVRSRLNSARQRVLSSLRQQGVL